MYEEIEHQQEGSKYPTKADVVAEVISEISKCRRKRHPDQPVNAHKAAEWLIGMLEQPNQYDAPYKMTARNGDSFHWVWPYLIKCKALANIFLHADRKHQDMILAAIEEDIKWRGESYEELCKLIPEFHHMREIGVEAYRKEAIAKMKTMAEKMVITNYTDVPF